MRKSEGEKSGQGRRAGIEARRHRRVAREVLRVEQINGLPARAVARDVSLGGMRMAGALAVEPGERVRLHLSHPTSGQSRELRARVVWRSGDCCGLTWLNLSPDMETWLREILRFWLGEAADR